MLNMAAITDITGEFFFGISDFMMVVPFSFLSLFQCLVLVRRRGRTFGGKNVKPGRTVSMPAH
jgi:hypothetical protein